MTDLIEEVKKHLGPKYISPWTLTEGLFRQLQENNLMGTPVVLVMEPNGQVSITLIKKTEA